MEWAAFLRAMGVLALWSLAAAVVVTAASAAVTLAVLRTRQAWRHGEESAVGRIGCLILCWVIGLPVFLVICCFVLPMAAAEEVAHWWRRWRQWRRERSASRITFDPPIECMPLSAWADAPEYREFRVSDLGLIGPEPPARFTSEGGLRP